jgi:hypothetical protein
MSGEQNIALADTPQVLPEDRLKHLRLPIFLREYDDAEPQCAADSGLAALSAACVRARGTRPQGCLRDLGEERARAASFFS